MDYPKSVPNVGLVNGKFVDENTATGVIGSLIPSVWGNAVTDELLAVIAAAGLVANEGVTNQVLAAIRLILQQGLSSYLPKRNFAVNDYIRIPDVAGGLIIQWGQASVNAAGDVNVNYPVSYSIRQCITLGVSGQNTDAAYLPTGIVLGGFTMPFYKTTTGAKSSGGFTVQWISVGV